MDNSTLNWVADSLANNEDSPVELVNYLVKEGKFNRGTVQKMVGAWFAMPPRSRLRIKAGDLIKFIEGYFSKGASVMDNVKVAQELLRIAKSLMSESMSMDEAFEKYNDGDRDSTVLNAFSEGYLNWFKDVSRKHKLGITVSDLKKAKKFNKALTKKGLSEMSELLANTLMVKDGKNPKQFNQRVEYNRDAKSLVKNMTPAEIFVVFLTSHAGA